MHEYMLYNYTFMNTTSVVVDAFLMHFSVSRGLFEKKNYFCMVSYAAPGTAIILCKFFFQFFAARP